jgi:hypothetical protein
MGGFARARKIFVALHDDATAMASIRAEYAALALELATSNDAGFDLTSSTINGISLAGSRKITKAQRFDMLHEIVAMADLGARISSTTAPVFPGYGDKYPS